jgi:hypothetical protein
MPVAANWRSMNIDESITYAIRNSNIDTSRIYVIE